MVMAQQGTKLHNLAKTLIEHKQRLRNNTKTLNSYVNDAIGFRMTPEVLLFYSYNSFGTADAISFRNNKLRIHDLKTGTNKASFDQLLIYVALFCLEYEQKPHQIDEIILRIYQNDEIFQLIPDPDDVVHIMDRIVSADKMLTEIREEELD